VAPKAARGEVAIALVGDRKMRDLNRKFRGIDKVTDVLSFTVDPGPVPPVPVARPFLGDIVIATGRAAKQARAAGLSEQQEWRRLALHGLLHLLGHDHERDEGQMFRLERRLRRLGRLPVD
jgi:probable rRNA maturation factor